MQGKTERWMRLAEMASKEQDSQRLLRIVVLINHLLEQKEARLKKLRSGQQPPNQA
jgi:hypothetical protein